MNCLRGGVDDEFDACEDFVGDDVTTVFAYDFAFDAVVCQSY